MQANTPFLKTILILEDQRIIGFDLQQQLQKKGFLVSYEKSYEDMRQSLLSGQSEIVISSAGNIYCSISHAENDAAFLPELTNMNPIAVKADTLVIEPGNGQIQHFPKPYNTDELIHYISRLMENTIYHHFQKP